LSTLTGEARGSSKRNLDYSIDGLKDTSERLNARKTRTYLLRCSPVEIERLADNMTLNVFGTMLARFTGKEDRPVLFLVKVSISITEYHKRNLIINTN
jgi:endo-1,4-beta-mannosidase